MDLGNQEGDSTILGSTLVKILFDTCCRDQLIHLGSNYCMN